MTDPTAKIDPRTAAQIEEQVQRSLAQYLPEFRLHPDQPNSPKPLIVNYRALVKIFARFSEIILQRLNQVPDKKLPGLSRFAGGIPIAAPTGAGAPDFYPSGGESR